MVWVLLSLFFLWRYYQVSREWAECYRGMTNDLVEGMVGHRTRLVQEDPGQWHAGEDQALDRYFKLSEMVDQVGSQLNSLVTRGWMLVGLLGIAYPFVMGSATPAALAVSMGGVLFAAQGLGKLVSGSQSLVSLFIAWQQVGPLFDAAARQRQIQPLDFVSVSQPPTQCRKRCEDKPSGAAEPAADAGARPGVPLPPVWPACNPGVLAADQPGRPGAAGRTFGRRQVHPGRYPDRPAHPGVRLAAACGATTARYWARRSGGGVRLWRPSSRRTMSSPRRLPSTC